MKKLIILVTIIFFSQGSYAKNIAIFLYTSEECGDKIYEQFTKSYGFERKFNFNHKNFEYHVTLGFIENVEDSDIKELKTEIKNLLKFHIKDEMYFQFGVLSMLGKGTPYIVALPKNGIDFIKLNNEINNFVSSYKNSKYKMSDFTQKDNYIPHLSLNAKLHKNIKAQALYETFTNLNHTIDGYSLPLSKLVIKSEK
ncbi:MAG: hypothetical protein ACK4OM_05025 [Alphaproteobacteria bacterium]